MVVLSQYLEPAYALRLLDGHEDRVGYLLKERVFHPAVLVDALRRVTEGETVVDPTIVARLMGRKRAHDPLADLSPREREVLALAAEGLSNKAIAARLFVTDRTVEAHMAAVFSKLGLEQSRPTRTGACWRCWRCCARSRQPWRSTLPKPCDPQRRADHLGQHEEPSAAVGLGLRLGQRAGENRHRALP